MNLPKITCDWGRPEALPGWSLPYNVQPLRERLAGLDSKDPLYPLLMGWLDAWAVMAADTRVSADHAAHQFVGQMNMIANIKSDLRGLWAETHRPPKA